MYSNPDHWSNERLDAARHEADPLAQQLDGADETNDAVRIALKIHMFVESAGTGGLVVFSAT